MIGFACAIDTYASTRPSPNFQILVGKNKSRRTFTLDSFLAEESDGVRYSAKNMPCHIVDAY